MEGLTISCESCERIWTMATSFTVYEQQALESRPCPHCGACTLTCHDLSWGQNREKKRQPVSF